MKNSARHALRMYAELNYVFGILFLALGCAAMEKADFGLSMVVAPAYLLYRQLSLTFSFITFGVMEYVFQAFLLILMVAALRRFRFSYLFSFITAVIYGYTLNGTMALVALIPSDALWVRLILYMVGMVLCSFGVSLMLHTYLSAEVYELIIKEIPSHFGWDLTRFKTVYDCVSCLLSLILSFAFFGFGQFVGISWGTVVCALVNGFLIGKLSRLLENRYTMHDLLPLRKFFDK